MNILKKELRTESGEIIPIEVVELLDDNGHIKKLSISNNLFDDNSQRRTIDSGQIFVDFVNEEYSLYNSDNLDRDQLERKRLLDNFIDSLTGIRPERVLFRRAYTDFIKYTGYKVYDSKIEMCPTVPFRIQKKHDFYLGHRYRVYGSLRNAFLWVDLYNVTNDNTLSFGKCKHCGHLFIINKKNQKYCFDCRIKNIPEMEKKKSNPSYLLKQKIYNRLYARSQRGDYAGCIFDGIENHFDFSEIAKEKKSSLSPDSYMKWLEKIEESTR